MEIVKQGDISRLRAKMRFECDRCGCEFVADDTEFKNPDYIEEMHDGIKAKCKCPTCGIIVYKY